jgi:hypothetical protein
MRMLQDSPNVTDRYLDPRTPSDAEARGAFR